MRNQARSPRTVIAVLDDDEDLTNSIAHLQMSGFQALPYIEPPTCNPASIPGTTTAT